MICDCSTQFVVWTRSWNHERSRHSPCHFVNARSKNYVECCKTFCGRAGNIHGKRYETSPMNRDQVGFARNLKKENARVSSLRLIAPSQHDRVYRTSSCVYVTMKKKQTLFAGTNRRRANATRIKQIELLGKRNICRETVYNKFILAPEATITSNVS